MGLNERSPEHDRRAIDALFDGELTDAQQRKLLVHLRDDAEACCEIAETRRAVSLLRDEPAAPDLTATILARVHRRRGFLPERWRRMITVGRAAAAAGLLCAVAAYALLHRHGPDPAFSPDPAPVSELVERAKADASQGFRAVAGMIGPVTAQPEAARPAPREFERLEARVRRLSWSVNGVGQPVALQGAPGQGDFTALASAEGELPYVPATLAPRSLREVRLPIDTVRISLWPDPVLISLKPDAPAEGRWDTWPEFPAQPPAGWVDDQARLLP